MIAWRSMLFMPATDDARIAKAHLRGADALILDLEDAVPYSLKVEARARAAEAITRLAALDQAVAVRINTGWRTAFADLDTVVKTGLKAVIVPKADSVTALTVLSELIGELEAERGLPAGGIGLIALIESPSTLSQLDKLAAVPRVIGLALGPEDFSASLGVPPSPASLDLPCRLIALAAAARGLMALGTPISIGAFRDDPSWVAAAQGARAIGMTGGLCIHPSQVSALNTAFSPSSEELADARHIVQAWAAAADQGVISLGGRMIDRPVVLLAQRTIAAARPLS